jgi:hypothetical protein
MQVINYYNWTLVKVTREEAWKNFNRGSQIVMCPCNFPPFTDKAPTTFMNKRVLKDMVNYGKSDKAAFLDFCGLDAYNKENTPHSTTGGCTFPGSLAILTVKGGSLWIRLKLENSLPPAERRSI